ncbi:hypothetical protein DFH06DRAFT_1150355 [Mycena polygramma]|nr:hypothetical protein DFH06DRAFT_1150355 [Mycena polygramma]
MSGTERTETECSEGNFAKCCEGNRRRAPKVAGGANRGLEGSTKRDSRLNGASETQGRKVTEIRESRRKSNGQMVTQVRKKRKGVGGANRYGREESGEDVWDFGKDVRDPERPESFSGASLGNRKSQNTIRTSVRGELDRIDTESKPSANGKDRGRAEATGSTGRFGSKPKGEGEEGVEWRTSRTEPGEPNGPERTPEVGSDVRCQRRRPEQIKGVQLSSLRLREEWKGGKEVVNDPDWSRSRGRAEDRRRPEISRADGEVARADRSTKGQRPEVVRTEVGGRTEGEPEVIGTESE